MKQYLYIVSMKKLCLYFLMVLFRELRNRIKIKLPFLVFFSIEKAIEFERKKLNLAYHPFGLVHFIQELFCFVHLES